MTMRDDPIVDEVRRFREARAARLGFDIQAIAADAKKRENEGGRKVVSLTPRQAAAPSLDTPRTGE